MNNSNESIETEISFSDIIKCFKLLTGDISRTELDSVNRLFSADLNIDSVRKCSICNTVKHEVVFFIQEKLPIMYKYLYRGKSRYDYIADVHPHMVAPESLSSNILSLDVDSQYNDKILENDGELMKLFRLSTVGGNAIVNTDNIFITSFVYSDMLINSNEIFKLTHLKSLYISGHHLMDHQVKHINNLYNLEVLDISKNYIDNLNLNNMENLRTVNAKDNDIVEVSIINTPRLRTLNVSHCELERIIHGPAESLAELDVSHNKLVKFSFKHMKNLTRLMVNGQRVPIIDMDLSDNSFLKLLDVSDNRTSDRMTRSIRRLQRDSTIRVIL